MPRKVALPTNPPPPLPTAAAATNDTLFPQPPDPTHKKNPEEAANHLPTHTDYNYEGYHDNNVPPYEDGGNHGNNEWNNEWHNQPPANNNYGYGWWHGHQGNHQGGGYYENDVGECVRVLVVDYILWFCCISPVFYVSGDFIGGALCMN